jgi:hypothetical protein
MSEGSAGVPEVERAEFPFGRAPIKGPLSARRGPSDLQHPPRLHAVLLPTHHDRLDHLPVALPTGEAGRSSARQPEAPGPGRGLA